MICNMQVPHVLSFLVAAALAMSGCADYGNGGSDGGGGTFTITTTAASFGVVGNAYSSTPATANGTGPFTWSIFGGALPLGLSLNSSTGAVTGTPMTAGNSTVTLRVVDSTGKSATGSVLFAIHTRTDRVSVDGNGTAGNSASSTPSINGDGSLIAFASQATNLAAGVSGSQIFVHNRQTNQIDVVSRDSNATLVNAGNGVSSAPSISSDGRFVAFVSLATNLVTSVSGQQVYLRDRQAGTTTLVSKDNLGNAGNGASSTPAISDDGSVIAYVSAATNLVTGVSGQQIYLFDRVAATTTLVSKDNSAVPVAGNGASATPAVNSTGQFVAFASLATNLGAAGGNQQIYVRDRLAGVNGTISLVSKDSTATAGNGNSATPSISGDGRFVAFMSFATNLVTGASGQQIYLHDQNTGANGTNSLVSRDNNAVPVQGNGASTVPSISSNGQVVTYASLGTNLLNPAPAVAGQQVYSFDRLAGATGTTSLVSKDNSVVPVAGNFASDTPSANSTGSFVAFSSQANNLVASAPVAASDVYVRALP